MISSILIPSRRNHAILERTIRSFLDTADKPAEVEILVRLHATDIASIEWAITARLPIRVVIGDDANGYDSLYQFNNCLAAMANGNWLWAWADDQRVLTKGWDSIIAGYNHAKPLLLNPNVTNGKMWRIPIISRMLYLALGHAGLTPHYDCYMDALARLAGIATKLPVDVELECHGVSPDKNIARSWAEYRSEASAILFDLDKLKLGAVMGKELPAWSTRNAPENPY